MGQCPFCHQSVEPDVLVNGGRCPHCLIEIPGEEAATDPGESALVREAEEAEAARRSPLPFLAVGALVLAIGVAGAFALRGPVPEDVAVGESGADIYKKVGSEGLRKIVLEDEPAVQEEPEEVVASAKPTRSNPRSSGNSRTADLGGGPEAPPPMPEASPDEGPATKTAGMVPAASVGGPAPSLNDPMMGLGGPGKKGPGVVEVCGDQVSEVLKQNMGTMSRKLSTCSSAATERSADFSSSVEATMVITKSGRVSDLSLRVGGSRDSEFEQCVSQVAKAYRFPRFCEDLEVMKTFRFGKGN